MELVNTIAFILIKEGKFLVERRKLNKDVDPGKVTIPGGHIDEGETSKTTMLRELKEELNITAIKFNFLCSLLQKSEEFQKIDYFVINSWKGELQNNEAEEIKWILLNELDKLDLEVDRVAIREYLRVLS